MTDRIKLKIDQNDYPKEWGLTSDQYESWIIGQLRTAGIPIIGFLVFGGVTHGRLTSYQEHKYPGVTVFIWEPNG